MNLLRSPEGFLPLALHFAAARRVPGFGPGERRSARAALPRRTPPPARTLGCEVGPQRGEVGRKGGGGQACFPGPGGESPWLFPGGRLG